MTTEVKAEMTPETQYRRDLFRDVLYKNQQIE